MGQVEAHVGPMCVVWSSKTVCVAKLIGHIWEKSGVRGVNLDGVELILVPMLGITCHIWSVKSLYGKHAYFDTNFLGPSEENAGYVESTWTKLKPFCELMLEVTCRIWSVKSLYRKRSLVDTNFLG